jgi:hypothetical protein
MKWAQFLHLYQPAEQQPDILAAIVAQSYRPIITGLRRNKRARITLNVSGVLLELFDNHGYHDLIDVLRKLGQEGRVEFTGSAKYHAFLPFLESAEIGRQIVANNETLRYYLDYVPRGFFPPEMGYAQKIVPVLEELKFQWLILDEIALDGEVGKVDYQKQYRIKGSNLGVFFRERHISNLVMSAVVRSAESLENVIKADLKTNRYLLTAMDGETFGHHRPGLEKMLLEIFNSPKFELITISEIPNYYSETVAVDPVPSTWASSKQDIDRGIQFISWADSENPIHAWQRELTDLALSEVYGMSKKHPRYSDIRQAMDAALASDHFWWASAKPWWSVEMIELGAFRLLKIIRAIPGVTQKKIHTAVDLYERIVSTAFEWQRRGKIREMMRARNIAYRIPLKDRTWKLGGVGGATYRAFLDMMHTLEKKAADKGEYEKAVLWRDAVWRIENKNDIYEAINAIDLLRKEIPNEEVEAIIDRYRAKYKALRGGQPEDRT